MKKKIVVTAAAVLTVGCLFAYSEKPHTAPEAVTRTREEVPGSDKELFTAMSLQSPEEERLRIIGKDAMSIINGHRNNSGIQILEWSIDLENVAAERAQECAKAFSYTRPDGSEWYTVCPEIQAGEIIAKNYKTAKELANALIETNIPLNGDFEKAAISPYKRGNKIIWVLEFGY